MRAGSRLAGCLARLMKEGRDACTNATRNGILLLLALFFLRDDQVGLSGENIATLDTVARNQLIASLTSALPDE